MHRGIQSHTRLAKQTIMIRGWSSKRLMASRSMADGADPNAWAETRDLTAIRCARNVELDILCPCSFRDTTIRPISQSGNAENRSIAGSVGGSREHLPGSI